VVPNQTDCGPGPPGFDQQKPHGNVIDVARIDERIGLRGETTVATTDRHAVSICPSGVAAGDGGDDR
jgi:hypothetical protein